MIGKNNHYLRETKDGTKVESYSIKKFKVGTASVVIGASIFLGAGAVAQASEEVSNNTTADNTINAGVKENVPTTPVATAQPVAKETTKEDVAAGVAAKLGGEVKALDKTKLEKYIAEIEAKLADGTYANKTEESIAVLKADLDSAKETLTNAKTQDEITKAYSKLVTTANTKLKARSVEKKETPAVDTTNGKETVGKKAENTEPKAGTNSIENTGSKDPRNGKALDKNNAFRTEATAATHEATTNKVGNISYTMEFSDDAKKEIYLYNQEDTNIDITVNSTAGNISSVKVRGGGNRPLDEATKDSAVQIDGFGWSYTQTLSETPGPVTMNITGKTNERFLGLTPTNRREDQNSVLGDRYLVVTDAAGGSVSAASNGSNQPGFFKLVVKSQTYKYDIKDLTEERRITVNDIDNITPTELASIKSRLKLEYSKKSNDARFVGGATVANPTSLIDTVAVSTTEPSKLVVTYKDGSVDTIEKSKVLNVKPAGIIPFSNPTAKEIYVYKGEETNIEFGVTDDSGKIKDLRIVQGSAIMGASGAEKGQVRNEYGLTMTSETNANGIVATTANPAITRITGTVAVPGKPKFVGPLMTRYLVAEDLDGALFSNPDANKNLDQEGAFKLVVREQTQKYDIQGQTEEANKVAVSDVNNLSDADFEKIKNNIKIQYKTSDDERLKEKDGSLVENASQYIQSVTKEGDKIVVTYKDGSTDKLTLTEVVTLDKQPAIDAVNTAASEKIAAINATPNTTDEAKAAAIAKVNADKEKALTAINDANVTTKDALNQVQNNGTTAINNVTPIAKAAAKKAINDELTAKNTEIDDRQDLSQAEKTAAKAEAKKLADAQLAEIAKQPDVADTPDAATTAQQAVDAAGTKGVADVKSVNPLAKDAAKADIETERQNKVNDITNNNNLSKAEKDAAVAKVNKAAEDATKAVDAVTTADALTTAKGDGTTAINNVTPVAKTAAKQAIADALNGKDGQKGKLQEIEERTDLTDEEKAAAKKAAQDKADAELAKINAQPDAADTPAEATTAQQAVDTAGTKGVADVKAVNPEAAKKNEAKKAIEDALTAKNNAIEERTDLTPEEKTKAKEIAKAKADAAKDAVDKATTNAEVDKAKTDGTTAVANVTPVAKEEAKKAIAKALEDKNAEIDKRTDLTDEEKTAAKNEAKDKADTQLAEIAKQPDAADTKAAAKTAQDAVDAAKKTGVDEVTAVNPVAVKKTEAKKAVEDALTAKNNAIDARTDLTDAEKKAAKDKAEEARKAKEAIDAATTDAAVDTAKNNGTGEIAKVNPVAKEAAKKAVADELAKKTVEIDARTDLTDAEKAKAKKEAQDKAKEATDAINTQPDNADTPEKAAEAQKAVDGAKDKGVADVKAVNPVAKEAAKKAVADELAKKEAEIDARTDLTQEEKDAAKKEAQDKAKTATDAINAQPDNADTPEKAAEAQKAVDAAKKSGVDKVAAVNPEAVTRPAAKKAIDDKLAKQLEDIANTPDATDEEKKAAADAAKTLAEEAKKAIDKAGTDAEVNKLQEEGKKEIEKSVPVVEDKPNARKAIEDEAKAKKEALDARTDLSPKAKEVLKAKVDKVAEKAKEAIDAVSSVEDVNTIEEANKTAIKAIGEVNRPIDKVLVKDPSALTAEEKVKILEEVKKVNPTAKEVKYDDNGNIEVTTEAGDKGIIDPTKLVKTEDQLDNGKGGNDINKPLDKVIVKDPSKLTAEEKAKIVAEVEEVNPDAIVTIDENGTVSVSTPDGKTAAIPASELVRTKEDTANPDAGNSKIVKPADKLVGNPTNPDDRAKVEEKLKELNPEAKSVIFDENGNATVTLKDGTTATIPEVDLFKSEAYLTEPKAGNDVVKPADKTVAVNPEKLTDAEKKAIEDKVKAVNPGATVVVDDKGNTLVTTPEGKTAVIPATDLVKSPEDATKPNAGNDIVKPADKTAVTNPEKLTDAEKKAIEDKVKAVNPGATVVVDDKGNATVTTPEGKTAVIPATDLVKSPEDATKPKAGNDIIKPADKTAVTNPEKLTDAEKKAIEDKVKAVNPGATVAVDDKGNATVTTPEGKTAVIPAADLVKSPEDATKPNAGNDIVKPADKTAVANKDALTPEEKKAIEDKVKAVNPGATVVVDDKGNATVTTPEGKTAVIPAADLVKSPEDATKLKAGNDIVKPADKTAVTNPEKLTDAEKKAIEDKVKAVNPGATVAVDDKGNATVTTPEGKTAVIPAADLVKSPEDATKPNAGNDIVKPADKTAVTNPEKLTDAEKKAIEDKVKAVNPGATVVVDDKGNVTVTIPEGKTAVIPATDLVKSPEDATKPKAGNDIVKPADKTAVANKDALTPEEKKAIEDKVKAVNPGATVVVDDKGNATVTTPEGKTAVIPAADLVKSPEDATKPNAGNDIVKPADKTAVANKDALTPEEKKAIEDKVKAVNPGATVVVDDKGNATVTTPEGKTAVIPATDLVKSPEDATKPNAGNDIVKPADKTAVANKDALTPEEKKAIEDKVKAVNPGATVAVDDKGNATVTTPEGKTAVIPAADLVKSPEDATKPKAGNDIVKPADKTAVTNPEKLTDAEKKAIEDKVKAVNPGATVAVDDKGNATVTTPEGKTAVIPATDLVKSPEDATKPKAGNDIVKPADKTVVANKDALTPAEKKAIEDKVKAVNPGATVVVDDKGNATVTTPEGKTAVIPATDLVKSPEDATKPNAGNDIVTPAARTVVTNPEKLTDAEKKAIEDKVKAVNPGATVVVDDKGNATVTTPEGKTAVIPATDLVKSFADSTEKGKDNVNIPADKTVVANPEKLTDAEKKAIEDKVKAVNPGATVVVDDKGNATVITSEGKAVVISATDLVKTSEDTTKPNAGNDIVKPANKVLVKDPAKLTDLEKKAIENSVVAVNPGAYVTVDDNGNVVVTTRDGKTAVIPVSEVTRTEEDATKANAGNDVNTPSAKTVVVDPEKLTDAEKKAIEDKVKAVNPGATVVVDDKGNATVTTPEGKTAVIPAKDLTKKAEDATKVNAGNDVNTPAAKTVVENPEKLTDAEKKAIEDKVKAVNLGATVVVDDKGNATVTTPEGKTAVISATDLVIPAENLTKEATNSKVKTPAIRTLVGDKENLTDVEKAAVKKAIEDVNPGAKVVVDDKGNATVTLPDGSTATIAKEQLVKDKEDAKAKNAGDNLEFDYSKVTVTDIKNITPEEKAKFQFMILGAITDVEEFDISTLEKTTDAEGNTVYTSKDGKVKITIDKDGNATIEKDGKKELAITIDKDGNVTIVTKDGKVLAIPTADAFKEKATDASTEGRINTPANRVLVTDKENLTPEELAMIKESVGAVNPGATVEVDAKGNVTVTTKDGKSATISVDQLVKTLVDVVRENDGNNINLNFEKQEVADLTNLTDADKAAAKAKILAVNPNAADVIFDAKGNATVVLKDGKAYTILAKDIFSQKGELAPSERNNGAANSNAQGVNAKLGQRLANTGTTETNTGLAGLGLGILGGLLAAARRRKNDKN